ncbi:hypothetical protein F4780DRAFT_779777 [Xylariomycetidae sp. FL0641]|nr:hypothetical protein F4780DRAFT_779777 [Xylariomycetidae sp. FL0641]
MKFFAAALPALATVALAAPADHAARGAECTPASYACKPHNQGWLVCNVDGTWLNGGSCENGTSCEYIDGLPYCV